MCHTLRLLAAMKEPWLRFQSHGEVRKTRTLRGPAARTARSTRNAPGRERLEPRSDLIVRVASQAPDVASQARLCKVVKKHDVIKLWLELELPLQKFCIALHFGLKNFLLTVNATASNDTATE